MDIQQWRQIYYQIVWETCSTTGFAHVTISEDTELSTEKDTGGTYKAVTIQVRLCGKLKQSRKLNNFEDFPRQAIVIFSGNNIIPSLENSLRCF